MSTSAFCRSPYRILVADEFPLARRGLRGLLSSDPELEVCGEVSNGQEVLPLAGMKKPDMIILGLGRSDELKAIVSIRQAHPETQILTMHTAGETIQGVLEAGAHGYILRSDAESKLLSAIRCLRNRRAFPSPKPHVVEGRNGSVRGGKADDKAEHELTKRELEIVGLLASGNCNKEVAVKLNLSTRTVEGHRNHIMHKMHFLSLSELVRFAIRKGLITA